MTPPSGVESGPPDCVVNVVISQRALSKGDRKMSVGAGTGLAGVVAGETVISTVGKEGKGLTYRGYSIHELAAQASFEEVAYLLLYGHLPTQSELAAYVRRLNGMRG